MAEAISYKEPIAAADPDRVHCVSTLLFLDSIPVLQAKGNKWGNLRLKPLPRQHATATRFVGAASAAMLVVV